MTVFAAVFARGGSKGVKFKNLREVGGIPLVGRAVRTAALTSVIDQVLCSTDSPAIAAKATEFGAVVPFLRPKSLSGDTAPEWHAWRHLADYLVSAGADEADLLVSLPATAPLRSVEDVANAVDTFLTGNFDLVLGISPAPHNPWFNMVVRQDSGLVSLAAQNLDSRVSRRQDAPLVYNITTVVYVTTLGFIRGSENMFEGSVGSVVVPQDRALDVDSEFDLRVADLLLGEGDSS